MPLEHNGTRPSTNNEINPQSWNHLGVIWGMPGVCSEIGVCWVSLRNWHYWDVLLVLSIRGFNHTYIFEGENKSPKWVK